MSITIDNKIGKPYVGFTTSHRSYRLTPLYHDDAEAIYSILKNESITKNLSNVPYPYTLEHAKEWLKIKSKVTAHALSTDWKDKQKAKEQLLHDISFTAVRDSEMNFVGDVNIRRNQWEWMELEDPEQRCVLTKKNETKEAGDPTICYGIGFYPSPDHQGKGIMTSALKTAIDLSRTYMHAEIFQGICRSDNIGSRKVFEKNGFVFDRNGVMPWKGAAMERS